MGLAIRLHDPNTEHAVLELDISGLDSFLTLKSNIVVPLSAITGMQTAPAEAHEIWHSGWRVGTHAPGLVSKGTWFGAHGRAFYFFHRVPNQDDVPGQQLASSKVLGISVDAEKLKDSHFTRLVIEVPEGSTAAEWKTKIEDAQRLA